MLLVVESCEEISLARNFGVNYYPAITDTVLSYKFVT